MGIDPGFRTGCKITVLDETGKLLDYTTVYPTEPQNQIEKTKTKLKEFIHKYGINLIAIGNGTASRETEFVVADMIRELNDETNFEINGEISYIIMKQGHRCILHLVGINEFPDLDVTIRGAISIGRRVQDSLAELVKIEPKTYWGSNINMI